MMTPERAQLLAADDRELTAATRILAAGLFDNRDLPAAKNPVVKFCDDLDAGNWDDMSDAEWDLTMLLARVGLTRALFAVGDQREKENGNDDR